MTWQGKVSPIVGRSVVDMFLSPVTGNAKSSGEILGVVFEPFHGSEQNLAGKQSCAAERLLLKLRT